MKVETKGSGNMNKCPKGRMFVVLGRREGAGEALGDVEGERGIFRESHKGRTIIGLTYSLPSSKVGVLRRTTGSVCLRGNSCGGKRVPY